MTDMTDSDSKTHFEPFSWEDIRRELDGLPEGRGLNIAHEAVDRHGKGERGDRCAIRWMAEGDEVVEMSCLALMEETNRFANVLKKLGVKKGGRVYVQSERVPELYVSALGALKYGAVFCPLFPAYGPDPVSSRIQKGGDGILVTSEKLYKSRIEPNRERLTCLKKILLTDAATDIGDDALSFSQAMDRAASRFEIPPTNPEDMALLHFTSGTTGPAKAAVHVHEAVLVHYATGKHVFDFRPDDVFWCTADPGWVTGTIYGIVSPLVCGVVDIVDTQDFDPARWLSILESQKVTVWYTAPTAIRRFMRLAPDFFRKYDLSHMRLIFSVGEPLGADAVAWSQKTLGLPIRDTWWQTETGGVMIANLPSSEVKAGFMGKPIPGIRAAIVRKTGEGGVELIDEPGEEGELALRKGWPSMFRGYLGEPERYEKCFAGDWYLSGDLALRDPDGFFRYVGRDDDIIKTAGHMVGPFEVESVLNEHAAVAESAVVGRPDPMIGQVVKAFVCLHAGREPDDDLRFELVGYARKRLGTAAAPREIEFIDELPKNNAGKILRKILKERETAGVSRD